MNMTWQHQGDNDWVFGPMVRGVVRKPVAEVYFNDGLWVWFLSADRTERGKELNFAWAVEAAEKALGISGD